MLFLAAYEGGRQARIAGLPRYPNPYVYDLPITVPPAAAELYRRCHCSWDAGWIFGERAALAAQKERMAA